jgi:hypothetical protein
VVTIENSGNLTPAEFAAGIRKTWGVGDSAANDGLVVLVDVERRRTEMAAGSGLQLDGLDGVAASGNTLFRVGEFDRGILTVIGALDTLLSNAPAAGTPDSGSTQTTHTAAAATTQAPPPATTMPTTTTHPAVTHVQGADSPLSIGPLEIGIGFSEAAAALGDPSATGTDEWGDPIYQWQLPGSASITYSSGSLVASCDPAGGTTIALPGGLSLCGSTLAELVDYLGDPHLIDSGEGQVHYTYDSAGNPWTVDSPGDPEYSIKAAAGPLDQISGYPSPDILPYAQAGDELLTWYWVYSSYY